MSPFVDDDAPLSETELKGMYIGVPIGLLISAAIVYLLPNLSSLPASQEDRAQFHKLIGISLSAEQTLPSIQEKDPITHALQQRAVDQFLWGRVGQEYQNEQALAKLQGQRSSLLQQQIANDADISQTKNAVVNLDAQIATAQKAHDEILNSWDDIERLISRCGFNDANTRDLSYAIFLYEQSLKPKQPPGR
jgi:hypothetical protein